MKMHAATLRIPEIFQQSAMFAVVLTICLILEIDIQNLAFVLTGASAYALLQVQFRKQLRVPARSKNVDDDATLQSKPRVGKLHDQAASVDTPAHDLYDNDVVSEVLSQYPYLNDALDERAKMKLRDARPARAVEIIEDMASLHLRAVRNPSAFVSKALSEHPIERRPREWWQKRPAKPREASPIDIPGDWRDHSQKSDQMGRPFEFSASDFSSDIVAETTQNKSVKEPNKSSVHDVTPMHCVTPVQKSTHDPTSEDSLDKQMEGGQSSEYRNFQRVDDWECDCGVLNFTKRAECCGCGKFRPYESTANLVPEKIVPRRSPVFKCVGWDNEVEEFVSKIYPSERNDMIVQKFVAAAKKGLAMVFPEARIVGFAYGDISRGKTFGVGVPEVEIFMMCSPEVLIRHLTLTRTKGFCNPEYIDNHKIQQATLRWCSDLLSEVGFEYRKSSTRGIDISTTTKELKVTLLAPSHLATELTSTRNIAVNFHVNPIYPLYNAALTSATAALDSRALELWLLVKRWAFDRVVCHISKEHGTLPAYAWNMMVIFFLQAGIIDANEQEPLLPAMNHFDWSCVPKHLPRIHMPAGMQKWVAPESQADRKAPVLLKEFFNFYQHTISWEREVVSIQRGKRGLVPSGLMPHIVEGQTALAVQDPFDNSKNLAAYLTSIGLTRMKGEIKRADYLCKKSASLGALFEPWYPQESITLEAEKKRERSLSRGRAQDKAQEKSVTFKPPPGLELCEISADQTSPAQPNPASSLNAVARALSAPPGLAKPTTKTKEFGSAPWRARSPSPPVVASSALPTPSGHNEPPTADTAKHITAKTDFGTAPWRARSPSPSSLNANAPAFVPSPPGLELPSATSVQRTYERKDLDSAFRQTRKEKDLDAARRTRSPKPPRPQAPTPVQVSLLDALSQFPVQPVAKPQGAWPGQIMPGTVWPGQPVPGRNMPNTAMPFQPKPAGMIWLAPIRWNQTACN